MSQIGPNTPAEQPWRFEASPTPAMFLPTMLLGGQAGLVVVLPGLEVAELAEAAIVKIEAELAVLVKKEEGLAKARALLKEDSVDYSGLTQNVGRVESSVASLKHDLQHMKLLAAYAKNLQWYVLTEHDLRDLRAIERAK